MSQPTNSTTSSTWTELQDDFELRNVVKFPTGQEDTEAGVSTTPGLRSRTSEEAFTQLPSPTRLRKILLVIGLILAMLDLGIMPIVYFYALTYASSLTRQYVFIVITCLFCMMTFAHYTHRCCRLLFPCSAKYGPLGWSRRWRLLEFTNINCAICATVFETCLVIGTAPTSPLIRLCTMPSSIICYYFGFLFLLTAFLSTHKYRLPFAMSSTPKGAIWRPALLAILEDTGAIEGRGEVAFRRAVLRRYEESVCFRRMMLRLTWVWGWGFLGIAVLSTGLVWGLGEENVLFGVGWGVPYVWAVVWSAGTVVYVKRCLREERRVGRMKGLGRERDTGVKK